MSRLWAGGLLALLAATWRLWWPWAASDYPAVPLLPLPVAVPPTVDAVLTVTLALLLIAAMRVPRIGGAGRRPARRETAIWAGVAAVIASLIVLDQHRLQPWAYQSVVYAIVFASIPPPMSRSFVSVIVISIYVYSAAGKFDAQFLHTVGQDFLAATFRPLGIAPGGWPETTRVILAAAFPATEAIVAALLVFSRTRRVGGVAAIGLHGVLAVLLSPFGLGHSLGVIVWNLLMAVQAYVLFVARPEGDDVPVPATRLASAHPFLSLVVGIVVLMPLTERGLTEGAGVWDHWTSWALYSPHSSRVRWEIHDSALDRLPDAWAATVMPDDDGDGWHVWSLSRLSLATRGVPVVPQARYQLALGVRLIDRFEIGDRTRATLRGVADRWTGVRTAEPLRNPRAMRRRLESFWLRSPR